MPLTERMGLLGVVCLMLFHSATFAYGQSTETASFTDYELQLLNRLNLCVHYGGQCGAVCPHQFIRHHWGVPICPIDMECCVYRPQSQAAESNQTPGPPPQTTTTTPRPPYRGTCGQVDQSSPLRKRIVGGRVARPGSWPWLVGFRLFLGSHVCSGALIAQQWVITAAHCFKYFSSPPAWRVRVGEYDLLNQDTDESEVLIDRIILHPGYRARSASNSRGATLYARYVHDIALVKLATPSGVQPICLPPNQNQGFPNLNHSRKKRSGWEPYYPSIDELLQERKRNFRAGPQTDDVNEINTESVNVADSSAAQTPGACWVAGWGATLDISITDQLLREVTGEVMDSQMCSDLWGTRLESDMMCFGNGTYGPCAGDSGGPLSCQSAQGRFYLEGVVSWGTEDCNVSGYPSVFTRVEPYLDWIREQMAE